MTQDAPWTLGRLLTWTTDYLKSQGVESARLEAEVLLAHARDCQRIELYTSFDSVADNELREAYRELIKRRASGEPVAYLVGHREFYSLDFRVTPDVLIPRPETEFVVVAALDLAREHLAHQPQLRIADVGTGSGILAICLARQLPAAELLAVDSSLAALDVARDNAHRHGVADRIEWLQGDLLNEVAEQRSFEMIVSNPPYVSQAEWEQLDRDVKNHEPYAALVAGERGDELIERLVDQAARALVEGGWLLLEISPMLVDRADDWFRDDGPFARPAIVKDLAQQPRVVCARRQKA